MSAQMQLIHPTYVAISKLEEPPLTCLTRSPWKFAQMPFLLSASQAFAYALTLKTNQIRVIINY